MKLLNRFFAYSLTGILTISFAFSGIPAITSYAAPEPYETQNTANMIISGGPTVEQALSAISKAKKSGNENDLKSASQILLSLSPLNRLQLYVRLNRKYYQDNFRKNGFQFFNAEKYLAANEDVHRDALKYSPDDLYAFALQHYLEHGITEGRSSETSFDPMKAILAEPGIMLSFISVDQANPESLYKSFVQRTGKTTTESYTVTPGSLYVTARVDNAKNPYAVFSGYTASQISSSDNSQSSSGTSVSDASAPQVQPVPVVDPEPVKPTEPEEEDDPEEDYRVPRYINNKSKDINPYILYKDSSENSHFSFTTYNPFDNTNNNTVVNVRFNGDNYRRAKELALGKKYTLMLYYCGTDLEGNSSYRWLSGDIVSMLQADLSNVNVLLCVGGTNEYGNSYMNQDAPDGSSFGASNSRSGIYYINPDAVLAIRDRLMKVNVDYGECILQLSGKSGKTDLSQGLHFDDIITRDSVIQLVSTSTVDMADPSFLAGFINLATDLFPAENYGLTLSNHGGGLEEGIIFTDTLDKGTSKLESNHISVDKLESALASTDLYKEKTLSSDGKLGLLFFNACMMASTGLAYNIKDYYRNMLASEETASGHTCYREILTGLNNDVANGRSDSEIVIHVAQAYEKYPQTHHGHNDVYAGTIAAFSSEDMEITLDNLNDLAREFSSVLGKEGNSNLKKDVFMAIRTSSLSCFPLSGAEKYYTNGAYLSSTDYVDIGELFTHVKYNIGKISTDNYTGEEVKELNRLISKVDKLLNSGFLTYLSIYNTEVGGIYKRGDDSSIPLNYSMDAKTIWTDIRADKDGIKDYIYGSSIYMPLGKRLTDFKKSNYYNYYKDSDLNDYVQFINDYLAVYNDESGYIKQMQSLAAELNEKDIYSKLITQVNTNGDVVRTIVDDNNKERKYISFKIADSYEEIGVEAPEHSTGNPMLDIIETQASITISAVHKQRFKANNGSENGVLVVDMVCAEAPVDPHSFALDSNTISFDVTDAANSIITGFTIEGSTWNEGTIGDNDWQFVLRSYADYDIDANESIVKVLFPDGLPADTKAITVQGSTVTLSSETGEYEYSHDSIHFFKKDGEKFEYCGSLQASDTTGNSYNKLNNAVAISAYHYVLQAQDDNDGQFSHYTKTVLEKMTGISDGYFAVTGKNGEKVAVQSDIYVQNYIGTDDNPKFSAASTGYYIDLTGKNQECDRLSFVDNTEAYYSTEINTGNGPLENIDLAYTNSEQINSIGYFLVTDEDTKDTEEYNENNVDPTNKEKTKAAVSDAAQNKETTDAKDASGFEEALDAEEVKNAETSALSENVIIDEALSSGMPEDKMLDKDENEGLITESNNDDSDITKDLTKEENDVSVDVEKAENKTADAHSEEISGQADATIIADRTGKNEIESEITETPNEDLDNTQNEGQIQPPVAVESNVDMVDSSNENTQEDQIIPENHSESDQSEQDSVA